MNLTYVRGMTSDWVLKENKRMKLKRSVIGSAQFDIEVLDTKNGKQFKLPVMTGLFYKNDVDKETFCYTPVQKAVPDRKGNGLMIADTMLFSIL